VRRASLTRVAVVTTVALAGCTKPAGDKASAATTSVPSVSGATAASASASATPQRTR